MFLILSIEAGLFLFFCQTEARYVLRLFLFFKKFEPQHSYKHGSYLKKRSLLFFFLIWFEIGLGLDLGRGLG